VNVIAKNLKRFIPYPAKVWWREKILNYYGIPDSRYGIPGALVKRFRGKPPITLIDVGASRGDFTQSLSRFCGISKALLIEVQPKRCEELRRKFPQSNIQILCAAAGSQKGEAEIEILQWDYSTSLLKINRSDRIAFGSNDFSVREKIETQIIPLDDICKDAAFLEPVDLLKLDVQGAEGMVLQGSSETLHRVRAVWTEVSFRPLYEGSITFSEIYDLFRNADFRLAALDDAFRGVNGELLQSDALFVQNAEF
jgi:FkbM family methyltransferase